MEQALKEKFQRLKHKWNKETCLSSNMDDIVGNKYYQKIIKMGMPVVPLILKDLLKEPNHWFEALREITGEIPQKPIRPGFAQDAVEAWIEWGKEKGLI
jgi:hypothetical protein